MNGPSHASVNWSTNSTSIDTLDTAIHSIAYIASHPSLSYIESIPFILNSGANCHISPKHGDFKTLNPIPPLTVKGFGSSSI